MECESSCEFCIRDETMARPRSLAGPHLEELQAFGVVARTLSFSRAAGRLAADQEAVRHRVDRLERLLDAKLFAADADTLQLTERGEDLAAALAPFEAFGPIAGDDPPTDLTDAEWAEAKRAALDLIQADKLDTPEAHLAYVRDRIEAALARDVV